MKLTKEQIEKEMHLNYQHQLESSNTLLGLVPLFYNLAISSIVFNNVWSNLGKSWGQEEKHKVKLLGRRGLIVVKIRDKTLEETYHPKSELKNIKLFVKRNNKWRLDKENYFGVKTGAYELERIYRYRKKKEKIIETCSKCGKPLEDYDE